MPAAAWKPSVPVLELWQSQKMGLRQVVKYHICVKFSMEGCQNSSWKRGFALFRTALRVDCHVTKHQSVSKFGMLTCDAFRS